MQQIVSITDARNNLSQLVASVAKNQLPVTIVRDSEPEAVLIPYTKLLEDEKKSRELWRFEWQRLMREGRKAGKRWAKKNKIDLKKTSEKKLYELIEKA